jgi:chorismate dehydratase
MPQALRIGVVDYLNAYPLWAALEGVELVRGVPSFLAGELLAGRVDAALISSVEYLRHCEGLGFHPGLCISATREVKSIRLFVHVLEQPFAMQLRGIKKIYTDISSRSSVAQLQVMLAELKLQPVLEEISEAGERIATLKEGEALLSIGDTALAHMHEPSYDLQREYFEIFSHGFVYALWVFRESLSESIVPVLSHAYQTYKADVSRFLSQATERFGFPADFTKTYLTEIIHHELSAEGKADLDFFAAKLQK